MNSAILLPSGAYQAFQPVAPGGISYAVGTWTPTIHGTSGSSQTYSTQIGRYIRVGAQVYISGDVTLSNLGSIAGAISIGGLPFTVQSSSGVDVGGASVFYFNNLAVNELFLSLFANQGTTDLDLYGLRGVAAAHPFRYQATDLTNTSRFAIFGIYQAA